ncbi:MAG: hypothetical protein RL701_7581 [Pseudomonadota bacterium]
MPLYRVSARAEARVFVAIGLCTALTWLNGGCSEEAPSLGNPNTGLPAVAGQPGVAGSLGGAAGVSGTAGVRPGLPTSGAGAGSRVPVAGTYSAAGSGGAGSVAGAGIGAGAGAGTSAGSSGNAGAGGHWDDADSGVPEAGAAASGTGGHAGSSGHAGAGTGGNSGVSGSSGSGGSVAAGSGGAGGATDVPHKDLGKGTGSDVVLLGDSWMSNTLQFEGTGGGIVPYLQRASGQPYRNYAVQGVMLLMADEYGPAIPTQWEAAKRADPDIKTVVMTGGGNDVIQSDSVKASCADGGEECKKTLLMISKALNDLWTRMADSGVQDVIYVRYADAAGNTAESLRGEKGTPWPAICSSGKLRCYSFDTNELVDGDIAVDGVHPLASANDRMAKAIVKFMETEGIRR